MNRILLMLFIFLCSCYPLEAGINKESALSLFVEGNLAYREGHYEKAVVKYEGIISEGMESGNLYFNLGNTYLKLNNVGKAILNYERARNLIPRDSDLKANYRFALLERKGASFERQAPLWEKVLHNAQDFICINEILRLIAFLVGLSALYHLFSLYFNWPLRISFPFYVVMCVLVSFLSVLFIISVFVVANQAIMIADAQAKFEPRKEATAYFDLYQGYKVRMIKSEGDWYKIERPDGKKGWVLKETVDGI